MYLDTVFDYQVAEVLELADNAKDITRNRGSSISCNMISDGQELNNLLYGSVLTGQRLPQHLLCSLAEHYGGLEVTTLGHHP